MSRRLTSEVPSPWPHRVSVLYALVVFPLIWVGGLVTTTDAGMAVPDWPNTFGYNLFAYPIYDWFFGPWDLFVEHGHRLLGSLAGVIGILVVWVAYRFDQRGWFRRLALIALLMVIGQGILGGMRVVLDERSLAKIHGCVGPAFFAIVVGLAVTSSRWWFRMERHGMKPVPVWPGLTILVSSYLQLVIGAHLRHVAVTADPSFFRVLVVGHVIVAICLVFGCVVLAISASRRPLAKGYLGWYPLLLVVAVVIQFALGLATWVVKYGWLPWFDGYAFAANFVIYEKTQLQMNIVTAHVAMGSLIVGLATVLVVRSLRVAGRSPHLMPDSAKAGVLA